MTDGQPFKLIWASVLLLTNAACQAEAGQAADRKPVDPAYDAPAPLKGQYIVGEETSELRLCYTDRAQCLAMPAHGQGKCWVTFTTETRPRLSEKIDGYGPEGGRLWLEGAGRLSTKPGRYGHLGAYPCQVEVSRIDVLEALPRRLP